jgi:hypothetical protein
MLARVLRNPLLFPSISFFSIRLLFYPRAPETCPIGVNSPIKGRIESHCAACGRRQGGEQVRRASFSSQSSHALSLLCYCATVLLCCCAAVLRSCSTHTRCGRCLTSCSTFCSPSAFCFFPAMLPRRWKANKAFVTRLLCSSCGPSQHAPGDALSSPVSRPSRFPLPFSFSLSFLLLAVCDQKESPGSGCGKAGTPHHGS